MCASKLKAGVLALALVFGATAWPVAAAEKKADPAKEQVRRLQQAQRKLEQEKAQLAEEKSAVEAERDEARKKAESEARRASSLGREAAVLRQARDEMMAKLVATEAELKKAREAHQAAESEGKRLQAVLAGEKQQHAACNARNAGLYKAGVEVLERYEKKSCTDSVLQGEPFTGLKRVEIENAVEDLRDKLDSFKAGS